MKTLFAIIAASVGLLSSVHLCNAAPIEGDGSLGDFTGYFTYNSVSATESTIEIELTNTSPLSKGGYLTAFAFNLPSGYITDVSLSSTDNDFGLLGGPDFFDDVKGVPYGYFDIGASVTDRFFGGGKPSLGIPVGATETFTFCLTGTNLDMLDLDSFLDEMSFGASPKKGSQFFLAGFKGNKTPGQIVPIPGAGWLLGCALIAFVGFRRKINKA